jgi:hypothetical protein
MSDGSERFVFVHLKPKSGTTLEELEAKMNLSLSWYRLDGRTWILYTNAAIDWLLQRLRPLVNEDPGETGLVICELNISSLQGWKPQVFWQWVRDPTKKEDK